MPARSKVPPEAATDPEVPEPPYYVATEDLYVGHPEAGTVAQLAYRAGDRVVPDVVAPNGWGGQVAVPPWFEGQLEPPPPPPPPDPAAPAPAAPETAGDAGPKE